VCLFKAFHSQAKVSSDAVVAESWSMRQRCVLVMVYPSWDSLCVCVCVCVWVLKWWQPPLSVQPSWCSTPDTWSTHVLTHTHLHSLTLPHKYPRFHFCPQKKSKEKKQGKNRKLFSDTLEKQNKKKPCCEQRAATSGARWMLILDVITENKDCFNVYLWEMSGKCDECNLDLEFLTLQSEITRALNSFPCHSVERDNKSFSGVK